MRSMVYTSRASAPMHDDQLAELLRVSRDNNARDGLTGVLLHRDGRFLQIIEGPDDRVAERMRVIAADDRHDRLHVLIDREIAEREFPTWSMGFEADSELAAALPGFRDSFDDLDAATEHDADDDTRVMPVIRELAGWYRSTTTRH